ETTMNRPFLGKDGVFVRNKQPSGAILPLSRGDLKRAAPSARPIRFCMECVGMKSRDTLIRLKRFQVEEKRRRVRQIEMMVAEFTRMAADLDREIAAEEKRAGISDPQHFAYPTYARAAVARRDNLKSSIGELAIQIEEAK